MSMQVDCSELGTPKAACKSDQQQGPIPEVLEPITHRPENGEEVLTEEGLGMMLSGPVSAANSTHRRPDQRPGGRVREAPGPVRDRDRGETPRQSGDLQGSGVIGDISGQHVVGRRHGRSRLQCPGGGQYLTQDRTRARRSSGQFQLIGNVEDIGPLVRGTVPQVPARRDAPPGGRPTSTTRSIKGYALGRRFGRSLISVTAGAEQSGHSRSRSGGRREVLPSAWMAKCRLDFMARETLRVLSRPGARARIEPCCAPQSRPRPTSHPLRSNFN